MSHPIAKQSRFNSLAVAASLLLLPLLVACGDVGDSSAVPGEDAGNGVSDDATLPLGEGGGGGDGSVLPNNVESGADSTPPDIDTGGPAADAAMEDVGSTPDAEADGSAVDSSAVDSSVVDSSVVDSSVVDSSVVDSSVADASDGSSPVDAGSDAQPSDASQGPLVPCTASGQTDCVQCQGNIPAATTCTAQSCVCTPTEAAIVEYDITKGLVTAAGPDSTGSCYFCLFNAGALDDLVYPDMGHECGDLPAAEQATCLTTLDCLLGSACAATEVSACYCGTAPVSGTCTSGGANGACKAQEAAGLGFAASDGLDILKNFTSTTLASGVANNVLQGALSNGCSVCLQ